MFAEFQNITEPIYVPDVYVSDLLCIEDAGDGDLRFVFVTRQRSIYGGDEHVVVARLVLPATTVYRSMKRTMQHMNVQCCGAVKSLAH